jgi:CRISPR-associated protein Cas1
MIKKVFELSQQAADLSAHDGQLDVRFHDAGRGLVTVPCEDLGFLVVDNPGVNYSHHALCELLSNGAAVVLCGRNHLPAGLLLPLSNHTEVTARLREQISVRAPLRKRLWQQLVIAKIRAQAMNLTSTEAAGHLRALARKVRSGDPKNVEAQAAKAYWRAWRPASASEFRRDPDAGEPLNAMLNYGYAVLRAAVARALVSSGLNPALGIHHANRSNAFCLADDLMEPLRPLVDSRVLRLHEKGERELSPPVKRELLSVLSETVAMDGTTGPLMVSLERFVASLVRCIRGEERRLAIPSAVPSGK